MQTAIKTRFRTGEESPYHAIYNFDGYLDGTSSPPPTAEEREIELTRGENFPPIRISVRTTRQGSTGLMR